MVTAWVSSQWPVELESCLLRGGLPSRAMTTSDPLSLADATRRLIACFELNCEHNLDCLVKEQKDSGLSLSTPLENHVHSMVEIYGH
jgi:hypothetical protein